MFQVDSQRPTVTIAAFTHGTFNSKKKKKIKFNSFTQDDDKKKKRFLVARTDTCCYVGNNFQDMFRASKMCSYYVGVLNKSTGKMQICDADLVHLNPNFPKVEHKREENSNLSKFDRTNRLIETFGAEKSKQRIEDRQHNIVEGEVLKEAIDGALKDTVLPEHHGLIDTWKKRDVSVVPELLPVCNVRATSVDDVYKLENIISPSDMENLTKYSQEIFNVKSDDMADIVRQEKYCQFVLDHLLKLPEDSIERQKMANCLLYFQYLVTLYHMKNAELNTNQFFKIFPEFLNETFLNYAFFSQTISARGRQERKFSSYQKDKIAIYVIVLALIVDDFKTPCFTIMKDLRMGRIKVSKLFGYVGCKITGKLTGENKTCAELTVPVQLKVVVRKRSRNT